MKTYQYAFESTKGSVVKGHIDAETAYEAYSIALEKLKAESGRESTLKLRAILPREDSVNREVDMWSLFTVLLAGMMGVGWLLLGIYTALKQLEP